VNLCRIRWFCILIAAALLAAGCATVPPGADAPKPVSHAFAAPEETALGRQFAAAERKHPGLSGFRLLPVGIDSFLLRMEMARAAQRSLDVQYFILQNDGTGKLLLEALLQAADRGVRVRILLDDYGLVGRDSELAALAQNRNVEVRIFNPFAYRGSLEFMHKAEMVADLARLNYRMHNKLFVADNELGVVGGRNIGDAYFQASPEFEFGDYDVVAAGPVVRQVSDSFDAYWNCDLAIPIQALSGPPADALPAYRRGLAAQREALAGEAYMPSLAANRPLAGILGAPLSLTWAKAEVVYDSPEKSRVENGEQSGYLLRKRLGEVARETRSELIIVSPYLVPGPKGIEFFQTLHERHVRVRALTNSLASTDQPSVHSGYRKVRVPMLEAGVELYEVRPVLGQPVVNGESLKSPSSGLYALHAKVFVFDRQRLFIGSMNLDPRSLRVNTEVGLIIDSPVLASQVARRFGEIAQPANSYVVALDGSAPGGAPSLVWHTLENGKPQEYRQEPAATPGRRIEADALSLLPLEGLL
jgi:putative cardiolipin synthase